MHYSSLFLRCRWLLCLLASPVFAQTALPLTDLSAFRPTEPNWRIAGSASASPAVANSLSAGSGTGVLVNLPAKPAFGQQYNLTTNMEHGDLDLDLDFMMARGSNSGVYLQGRYEVQLHDSWGTKTATASDVGSIYERWDESQPDGKKGYEGHPARQNASRAPGLWQHLRVSFQAPRFDVSGKKTENARMVRVELNGVVIHEDVELSGPTRGPAFENEAASGPLMIQGDHGPVAFRNIRYVSYDKPRPELLDLKYGVFKGKFQKEEDFTGKTPPEAQGASLVLSSTVSRIPNDFMLRYTGTLRVAEPGEYKFNVSVPGGGGILRINNQPVIARVEGGGQGNVTLPKGDLPFELLYSKLVEWVKPGLGLTVSGPGVREFTISDQNAGDGDVTDPILIEAAQQPLLRSFMDLPGVPNAAGNGPFRVVHAVSVGDAAEAVHYTYDLDNGALVQLWRGQFLDATPMWHDRGDGSSRPLGMTQRFGKPALALARLSAPDAAWPTDTSMSGYRPKGYAFDQNDRPTFRYLLGGATVEDQIRPLAGGQGISRTITMTGNANDMMARLATGNTITMQENGLYAVDGQFYVRADGATVRSAGGRQELLMPVKGKVAYSILF